MLLLCRTHILSEIRNLAETGISASYQTQRAGTTAVCSVGAVICDLLTVCVASSFNLRCEKQMEINVLLRLFNLRSRGALDFIIPAFYKIWWNFTMVFYLVWKYVTRAKSSVYS